MRSELLALINKIDSIKSNFNISKSSRSTNIIYKSPEFLKWKQEVLLELQDIYDRTNDHFVWQILVILRQGFSGWKDEQSFNELSGGLLAIQKNIDKYYPSEIDSIQNTKEVQAMHKKNPKIFISHSSQDKEYATYLVDLLVDIGLNHEQLFCSSVPGYDIPLNEDIYEYLRQQFQLHNLHVIFILSENYYKSIACMNEMGAAWILQNKYSIILLPGFEFLEIKGAINPRQIGLKLDGDTTEVKEKLGQLKDDLTQEFRLIDIPGTRWERKRDAFIKEVSKSDTIVSTISEDALNLLQAACDSKDGTIIKTTYLSGTYIETNGLNFINLQERREIAKWEGHLAELLNADFVQSINSQGNIFVVSAKGYNYVDKLKE